MRESIDIFNIHQKIMDDYKHFVSSFINIKDKKIKEIVETEINQGKFWPEPLIQFNPSFEQGESAQSLCDKGILHHQIEAALFAVRSPISKGVLPADLRQKLLTQSHIEKLEKRDNLIDALEKRLEQKATVNELFTIRWAVV